MAATDRVLLSWSLFTLGGLFLIVAALFVGGVVADRIRSVLREREHASAGSAEQREEHARMRAERVGDMPLTQDGGLTEAERLRRTEWRARLDTEIADINERFDALVADFNPEERVVWKVDVSRDALNRITREQVYKLGPPPPRKVLEWATGDLDLPDPSWRRKRSKLPSLARVLRDTADTH
jgi:hypothetical protein